MSESIQSSVDISHGSPPGDKVNDKQLEREDIPQSEQQDEPVTQVHATTFLALFAICLIYFAQTIALVGTGSQGQAIAGYFKHPEDVTWLTTTLTIPSVVFGPIVAQTADYWGRKWFLVAATIFGTAGCIIAARADSFAMFIAGMTITGLELGALPLLHTVPSEILPRRWRAPAQAALMVANSFGLILGLLLAGLFGRHGDVDGFRKYYYVCTGLFGVATIIVLIVYNPPPTPLQKSLSFRQKIASLDWLGYVLLASSLVLFCMGLAWSQNPYEWSDPHPSAPFSIGVALGLCLVVYETKFKKDGMFHHGLFTGSNWNFSIATLAIFCEGVAFFAATVYFPFQINILYEDDTLLAAVRFAVAFIATIPASIITGLYCTIAKKVRWVTVLSSLIFVAFFSCMATTDESTDENTWGYPVLLGFGLGMTLITLVTVAQLSTPPELISVASGLMLSVRSLGGCVGIAIFNAVFVDETRHLGERIAEAAIVSGLQPELVEPFLGNLLAHNETGLAQVPGVTPEIIQAGTHAFVDTFVAGFHHVWATAAAFVALSAIAAVFLIDPTQEFNNHIDAPVEKT